MGQPEQRAEEATERVVGREVLRDLDMTKTLVEIQQHIEGWNLGIMDCQIE